MLKVKVDVSSMRAQAIMFQYSRTDEKLHYLLVLFPERPYVAASRSKSHGLIKKESKIVEKEPLVSLHK